MSTLTKSVVSDTGVRHEARREPDAEVVVLDEVVADGRAVDVHRRVAGEDEDAGRVRDACVVVTADVVRLDEVAVDDVVVEVRSREVGVNGDACEAVAGQVVLRDVVVVRGATRHADGDEHAALAVAGDPVARDRVVVDTGGGVVRRNGDAAVGLVVGHLVVRDEVAVRRGDVIADEDAARVLRRRRCRQPLSSWLPGGADPRRSRPGIWPCAWHSGYVFGTVTP